MHGFLWVLHKDHHKKDHKSWFERNDTFFFFYAVVSMLFVISWSDYGFSMVFQLRLEFFYMDSHISWYMIFLFIKDLKFLERLTINTQGVLRRAHKIHHKNINKEGGECLECFSFQKNILNKSHFSCSFSAIISFITMFTSTSFNSLLKIIVC